MENAPECMLLHTGNVVTGASRPATRLAAAEANPSEIAYCSHRLCVSAFRGAMTVCHWKEEDSAVTLRRLSVWSISIRPYISLRPTG